MNIKMVRRIVVISLTVMSVFLLIGCRSGELEEAASERSPSTVTRGASVDPADHKFFVTPYEAVAVSVEDEMTAIIDPADRKFLGYEYAAASSILAGHAWTADTEPADRKIFSGE